MTATTDSPTARALSGALALARFDRKGMEQFDFSIDGFWRSFNAILLCLPVVLAAAALTPALMQRLIELNPSLAQEAAALPKNMGVYLVFETLGFLAGWIFFPLAMIPAARMLGLTRRYVPLIISLNWCRVLAAWVLRLPVLLFALGAIDAGLLSFFWFTSVIWLFVWLWFVIRTATETSGATAFALLLLDVLGATLMQALVSQIYWLTDPLAVPASGNA